jgi:hypothetical protein
MIRSMYAELLKLRRPAIIYGAGGAMLGFALLATVLTYATATAAASFVGGDSLTRTVGQLGQPGGLTRGFTIAAGFIGLLVFVLFTTSITSEHGRGTIRVLLLSALLVASLFGTVGMAVGVLTRSTPLALGIGLAWLAPLEHLIQLSWSGAGNWLPGLVFDAVAAGGTTITTYPRALITALACAAFALAVGALSFLRRDVSI